MRTEDLLDAIGGVDDELLQRSEKVKIKKMNPWKVWVPLAACLCLVLGLRLLVMPGGLGIGNKSDSAADSAAPEYFGSTESDGAGEPMEDADNESSASCDGKEAFDNIYALSMTEANEAISATRYVTIDIVKSDTEYVINIEDGYTIFNTSGEKVPVEFAYMYNMDHNGTRPIFVDEEGEVLGKAGTPIEVTIPANGQIVLKGQYEKSIALDEEYADCFIHGCKFTNLDVTKSIVTINRNGNIETLDINPIEDYYLE